MQYKKMTMGQKKIKSERARLNLLVFKLLQQDKHLLHREAFRSRRICCVFGRGKYVSSLAIIAVVERAEYEL